MARANRHLPSGLNLIVNDKITDRLVKLYGDQLHGLGLRRFAELRDLVAAGVNPDVAYERVTA
jgi:hypothetical protein